MSRRPYKFLRKIIKIVSFGKLPKPTPNHRVVMSEIKSDLPIDSSSKIMYSDISGSVSIGAKCMINKVQMTTRNTGRITVGKFTSINGPNTDLFSFINPIEIGSFCSIARNVFFQEINHNLKACTTYFINHHYFKEPFAKEATSKGAIIVGNDVWIGAQSIILSGVKIGNGAVIAANSVVNSDVPDYAIYGGTPAKLLGFRFEPEIINELLRIQWWNWSDEELQKNSFLFKGDLTLEKLKELNQ